MRNESNAKRRQDTPMFIYCQFWDGLILNRILRPKELHGSLGFSSGSRQLEVVDKLLIIPHANFPNARSK